MKFPAIIMVKQGRINILFLLFFLSPFLIYSQVLPTAKLNSDRNHVLLGEQVNLSLDITTTVQKPVIKWYNLPDSFNHLEILKRSAIDSSTEGTIRKYHQTFVITGFDSGIWTIPAVSIGIGKKIFKSDSLSLTIVPVQLTDSTYHDIREIIEVPITKSNMLLWIGAIISLIILGVLVYLWMKSRTKTTTAVQTASQLSAYNEAMQRLQLLKSQRLPEKGEIKKYYSELSEIFKKYIQQKFGTPAQQSTTDEILIFLSPKLDKGPIGQLAESLRIGDAVKFAKYQPVPDQNDQAIATVEKILGTLDHLKT
ncbi:MAG: hypothetical protein C5B52_02590 [Bacteroidetes bacterium]|nr:MAG: hypothetical protein C5B52_02590 [Bacteroidota bacterium]